MTGGGGNNDAADAIMMLKDSSNSNSNSTSASTTSAPGPAPAPSAPVDPIVELIETFRPILELLWPNETHLETNKDVAALVQFFKSRGIYQLNGIGAFDAHHFKLKREECPLFESEYLVGQLGYVCRYIAFKGPHAFLSLKAKLQQQQQQGGASTSATNPRVAAIIAKIETAVARHISKHSLYQIGTDLDLSPRGLGSLSLVQARRWLTHLLSKLDFWNLPFDEQERRSWIRKGALHLLDRFPVLASEHVKADKKVRIYPYAYMLWGGFDKDIIKHVINIYPRALIDDIRKNEHMNFLKEHRTRCQIPLPLPVIQTLLSANKSLLQTRDVFDRRTNPLVELLIRYGYPEDVLAHALRSVSRDINSLWLTNFDLPPYELSEVQAQAIDAILPQLRFLECRLSWSIRAETLLLMRIAHCCKHNNNLESLKMTLSPFAFYNDDGIRRALRTVMANLNKSLRVVSWNLYDATQLENRRFHHPSMRRAACDVCLQALLDGFHHNSRKKSLHELTLQGFTLSNSQQLDVLLTQEDIGCLNIQLDANYDMYNYKMMPLNSRPRIQRLNLYECCLSDETQAEEAWSEFWHSVSLTTALESILLVPRHRNVAPEWVPVALDAVSHLPTLRRLELGPHSYTGQNGGDPFDTECVDITDPLTALLELGCLETLKIHGAGNQYLIHVDTFCEALSQNKTLRSLDLLGTVLEGFEVTKAFWDALQQSNNVTIQHATIYDDGYFYTPTTIDTHRRKHNNFEHYRYENYQYASQILHLCDSNLCGRGWVQKKSTKVCDLVGLLDSVRPTLGIENEDFRLLRWFDCADLAWPSRLAYFNQLYPCLRKNPMLIVHASQLALDTVSIQYTLLRENPGMWCQLGCRSSTSNSGVDGGGDQQAETGGGGGAPGAAPGTPRKRQRVE